MTTPEGFFKVTINIWDFDGKVIKSYPNVPIPWKPEYNTYLDCLHYLKQYCPLIENHVIYGITPPTPTHFINKWSLRTFEGNLYPEVQHLFHTQRTWNLKPVQKWNDIYVHRKLDTIERLLEGQTKAMEGQTEAMANGVKLLEGQTKALETGNTLLEGQTALLTSIKENTASNKDADYIFINGQYYHRVDNKPDHMDSNTKALTMDSPMDSAMDSAMDYSASNYPIRRPVDESLEIGSGQSTNSARDIQIAVSPSGEITIRSKL